MIETGIRFGDIHSFYDLDLVLSSVEIPPAIPRTNYIEIEGRDGALDVSEALGEMRYQDRTGCKFTFTMNPQSDLSEAAWEAKKTEVSNALNGLAFKITLDKDPEYYYSGRCSVDNYQSNKRLRQFVITARLHPYKFKQKTTVVTIPLTDDLQTVVLRTGRKTVIPTVTCTNDETVVIFDGSTFVFSAGTHNHQYTKITLKQGENPVKVRGSGSITFEYQEADL